MTTPFRLLGPGPDRFFHSRPSVVAAMRPARNQDLQAGAAMIDDDDDDRPPPPFVRLVLLGLASWGALALAAWLLWS